MKAEQFSKECPKCGCQDKDISTVRNPVDKDKLKEAGIQKDPKEVVVGAIKCSECGHLFEYCKDGKCVIEVKKVDMV